MTQIMWSQAESLYRGQSSNGTVVTVDDDALQLALKKAGNSIFDTEWWLETLITVLEHWGLKAKRWVDPATQVPRIHYRMGDGTQEEAPSRTTTSPLATRMMNSGGLNSGKLNEKR